VRFTGDFLRYCVDLGRDVRYKAQEILTLRSFRGRNLIALLAVD